ncbi:uncharacterized protein PADG_04223 [Paracoccidioides brasiliensis Pb18]|uniref:2-dehydropantoate 2-reductase n=1 Tax=Paracoccidioides brasiliensis (strain Pb18) TaxID=502780 RepID=C1GAD7_PARBD|nr:uncharacterized protein PADG_04223 [Paracoccidioides brasiliensis Pb18]EEH48139.2 hypothetical protein PADG_04223 [Paracoccidioides brasiliensis Pb18]
MPPNWIFQAELAQERAGRNFLSTYPDCQPYPIQITFLPIQPARSKAEETKRSSWEHGFTIDSVDHGNLTSWRPIVNSVPKAEPSQPFDYVVVTMKTIPELCSIPEIIQPAVTPGHTSIVLIQNGIYIEEDFIKAFPTCVLLSGASYIGAQQRDGHVSHNDRDCMDLGAFRNPSLDASLEKAKLDEFATAYTTSNFVEVRKLDSTAIRQFGSDYSLIRPAMAEVVAIAKADGYDLGKGVIDDMIETAPIELSFRPSMLVDVDKGNPVEAEAILGNALLVARAKGVPTPILDNIYRFLRLIQARLLASRGLIKTPKELPKKDFI